MRQIFAIAITLFCSSCIHQRVDLVVHHAQIYTVNDAFTVAEAMAVQDGKIVAVGSNDDILKTYQADSVVDAKGATVYPGFVDAHAHFLGYGQSLYAVDLMFANSWAEVLERVKAFVATHPGNGWIRGRGWDQNRFPGKQFPTNEQLNSLFPDRPVILERVDGHASIANNAALAIAGIKAGQTMEGGSFVVANGKLTGLLIDNAVGMVEKFAPAVTKEDYKNWLTAAQANCFATGLTTITPELGTVQIFPNPASDQIMLEFSKTPVNDMRVRLLSNDGRPVKSLVTRQKQQWIPIATLPAGMYYVEVGNGKNKAILKILKF